MLVLCDVVEIGSEPQSGLLLRLSLRVPLSRKKFHRSSIRKNLKCSFFKGCAFFRMERELPRRECEFAGDLARSRLECSYAGFGVGKSDCTLLRHSQCKMRNSGSLGGFGRRVPRGLVRHFEFCVVASVFALGEESRGVPCDAM